MPHVDFYYDFSCPYAYLAYTQVEALCLRNGASLELRPVLLGGVYNAWRTPQHPAEVMAPSKLRHNGLDVARWAAFRGVPLRFPATHPMRTVEALRLLLAAPPASWATLGARIYRAYWVDNLDVHDRQVLASLAREEGLDADALLARIDTPEIKAELRQRTEQAVARGVFGVPTFFVDEEQFWGQDRLEMIERRLRA